jgi:branched-chain amino acid transport system permease protein
MLEAAISLGFNILSLSSILILVVLGLAVIVSMMGIFNFAHGELVLLGAYTVYLFGRADLPLWLGMVAAPITVGVVGLLLERLVIRRFYAAPIVGLLGTYAIALAVREAVRGLIAGRYLAIDMPIIGSFTIGGVSLSRWRLAIIIVTAAVMVASYLLLNRTRFGLQARAALENPSLARASGISTNFIYAATFMFGAALAGLAGGLMVPLFSLYADLGMTFLIKSFLAVMLGGIGSFEGPIVGAGLIGAGSAALPWVIRPVFADVLVFLIAIAIVKLKPAGLISKGRI